MARSTGKIPLSQDVEERYFELYHKLCDEIGGDKYRVLEAAIEAFSHLPGPIQTTLMSYKEADRQLCFELIAGLGLPLKRLEPGRTAKSARSA